VFGVPVWSAAGERAPTRAEGNGIPDGPYFPRILVTRRPGSATPPCHLPILRAGKYAGDEKSAQARSGCMFRHWANPTKTAWRSCIGLSSLCAGLFARPAASIARGDHPPDGAVSPGVSATAYVLRILLAVHFHCDFAWTACPTEAITESKLVRVLFPPNVRECHIQPRPNCWCAMTGRPQKLALEDFGAGGDETMTVRVGSGRTSPSGDSSFRRRRAVGQESWVTACRGLIGEQCERPNPPSNVIAPSAPAKVGLTKREAHH